jgi:hypothetical protein
MQPISSFARASTDDCAVDPSGMEEHNGEGWTEQQIILLARLIRGEGLSNAEVAIRMGRTESSIATAASRYCARDPKA